MAESSGGDPPTLAGKGSESQDTGPTPTTDPVDSTVPPGTIEPTTESTTGDHGSQAEAAIESAPAGPGGPVPAADEAMDVTPAANTAATGGSAEKPATNLGPGAKPKRPVQAAKSTKTGPSGVASAKTGKGKGPQKKAPEKKVPRKYTYSGKQIPEWIVKDNPSILRQLEEPVPKPNNRSNGYYNIWGSSGTTQTDTVTKQTLVTDFIPYQCCPVVGCHYGPNPGRHFTQQEDSYLAAKFLRHWLQAHASHWMLGICRRCCYISRWRDDLRTHLVSHASQDIDFAELKSEKGMPASVVLNKHVLIVRLSIGRIGQEVLDKYHSSEPWKDPDGLVVDNISATLPNVRSPLYSHWQEAGCGKDFFQQEVSKTHQGEWWSLASSQYRDDPKCHDGHTVYEWNILSPAEQKRRQEANEIRKRQRHTKAEKTKAAQAEARPGTPDSTGPPVKRSRRDSTTSGNGTSAPSTDGFITPISKNQKKVWKLERNLELAQARLNRSRGGPTPSTSRGKPNAGKPRRDRSSGGKPSDNKSFRRRKPNKQSDKPATKPAASAAKKGGQGKPSASRPTTRSQTLPLTTPTPSGKRDVGTGHVSPLMARGGSVNVSGSYQLPETWDCSVDMSYDAFALDSTSANLAKRPITQAGKESGHTPGTIKVTHVVPDKAKEAQATASKDTSYAGVTEKPADPFPGLPTLVAKDTHIANTPLPTLRQAVRAQQAEVLAAASATAGSGPTGAAATVPASPAKATTTGTKATPVRATPAPTTPGPRPPQRVIPTDLDAALFLAYSATSYEHARRSAGTPLGAQDKVDSVHGDLYHAMVQAGEAMQARVVDSAEPSHEDKDQFDAGIGLFVTSARHYRERRTLLHSMEESYERGSSVFLHGVRNRLANMSYLYGQQQKEVKSLQDQLTATRRQLDQAQNTTKRLQELSKQRANDLSVAKAEHKARLTALVSKTQQVSEWKQCYRHLQMEVKDLCEQHEKLHSQNPDIEWHKLPFVRVSSAKPPWSDSEEAEEDSSGETIPMLTQEQMDAIEISRNLDRDRQTMPSQPEVLVQMATAVPVSSATPGSQSGLNERVVQELLALTTRMDAMAERSGHTDLLSPSRMASLACAPPRDLTLSQGEPPKLILQYPDYSGVDTPGELSIERTGSTAPLEGWNLASITPLTAAQVFQVDLERNVPSPEPTRSGEGDVAASDTDTVQGPGSEDTLGLSETMDTSEVPVPAAASPQHSESGSTTLPGTEPESSHDTEVVSDEEIDHGSEDAGGYGEDTAPLASEDDSLFD